MNDELLQSLTELEGNAWGEPTFYASLVTEIHRLRHKPIGEFTAADLRINIGQGVGMKYLVPLALELLERDPFIEGNYYPGDLLCQTLRSNEIFWQEHPTLLNRLFVIAQIVTADCDDMMIFRTANEFIDKWQGRERM